MVVRVRPKLTIHDAHATAEDLAFAVPVSAVNGTDKSKLPVDASFTSYCTATMAELAVQLNRLARNPDPAGAPL